MSFVLWERDKHNKKTRAVIRYLIEIDWSNQKLQVVAWTYTTAGSKFCILKGRRKAN